MTLPHLPPAAVAYAVATAVVLAWNVVYAGRIARLRRAPRPLALLSGVCGLLVVPALVAHVAASSLYGGRAVGGIGWIWPVTTLLFVAQAAYATLRRLVTPLLGVPLLVYDLLVALVTWTRYAVEMGTEPPLPLLALSAAQAALLGTALGRAALASPLALWLPLLMPAYPARWRLTRTARALLATAAAFVAAVTALELPRGVGAVRSYLPYATERLSERPRGDFAVGVHLLPTLGGAPPSLAARWDLPLLDSLDVDAVHVTLRPSALTYAALDSLARLLEPVRRDSTLLFVALGFDAGDGARRRAGADRFDAARLDQVERVARALRPDVLLPASAPYGDAAAELGPLSLAVWRAQLAAAADRAHAINRRIRVGVTASSYDAADSALYAWAASAASPLDVVGFTVAPSFTGGGGVDARLRAADRWMRAAAAARAESTSTAGRAKAHWVFDVRAYPVTHGEASQERTVWHTLAWATERPAVRGVLVAEPGDYAMMTGLRAANGRLRSAVPALQRALRGLRETVAP